MMTTELWRMGAADLAKAIRTKQASSREVVEAHLARSGGGWEEEAWTMAMTFELWRLIAVEDEARSTWELVGRFPNAKRARLHIYELAGNRVVSPEDNVYWYEDVEGIHTFRIEAVPAAATEPH